MVDRTYKAYWKMVREHISNLPLKEDLTDMQFQKLQPNVNIPSLGKLCVTLDRYKGVKKKYKRIKEYKEKNNDVAYKED